MNPKERIYESYQRQSFMQTLGAKLVEVETGRVSIECPYHPKLLQQNGFIHAGVMTTLADVSCGYAAWSVMPAESDVLSVEFKTSFMRPAKAQKLIATGRVIKAGKNLTFCEAVVTDESGEKELARMLATMMCIKR